MISVRFNLTLLLSITCDSLLYFFVESHYSDMALRQSEGTKLSLHSRNIQALQRDSSDLALHIHKSKGPHRRRIKKEIKIVAAESKDILTFSPCTSQASKNTPDPTLSQTPEPTVLTG